MKRNPIVFAALGICLAGLCGWLLFTRSPSPYDEKNLAAARNIALSSILYSHDQIGEFPKTVADLLSAKLLPAIPTFICDDGTVREFVYFPGYSDGDGNTWVIVAAPVQPNRKTRIVAFLDGTSKALPISEADTHIRESVKYLSKKRSVSAP